MFMNGAKIGIVVINRVLRRILLVQAVGRTVCAVAVVGTTARGTVAHPIAASRSLTTTVILACASSSPSNIQMAQPFLI